MITGGSSGNRSRPFGFVTDEACCSFLPRCPTVAFATISHKSAWFTLGAAHGTKTYPKPLACAGHASGTAEDEHPNGHQQPPTHLRMSSEPCSPGEASSCSKSQLLPICNSSSTAPAFPAVAAAHYAPQSGLAGGLLFVCLTVPLSGLGCVTWTFRILGYSFSTLVYPRIAMPVCRPCGVHVGFLHGWGRPLRPAQQLLGTGRAQVQQRHG